MGKKLCAGSLLFAGMRLSAAGSGGGTDAFTEHEAVWFFAGLSLFLLLALFLQFFLYRRKKSGEKKNAGTTSEYIQHAARQDSFFNMVLGHIPCQVFIKDPLDHFRYKIANRAFSDYYHLCEDDVIGHPDEDIFDHDVAMQLRGHDKEVCASPGTVFRFDEDISFLRRGHEIFKSLKVCFKTSDGHPYMLGVCVDVTEIIRNTHRLQKTQDLLNLVINTLPVNIFAKNADDSFRYTIANRTFAEFVGKTQADIIGKTDSDLFQLPRDCADFLDWDRKVMAETKILRFTEAPVDCNGVQHQLQTIKLATAAPDGSRMLLGLSLDITDLSNLLRTERINNDALSQAVAESDFRKVVERSAQTLRSELNCSRIIFLTYSPEEKLKLFHEEHASDLESVAANGLENHEKLWNLHIPKLRSSELVLYEDLRSIPEMRPFLEKFPDYPTRSLAAVPIFVDDNLLGGLLISYSEPHVFRKDDKDLLLSMGKIISLSAIRDRQTRRMRQVEEENQALLDNISIPLWLYDSAGRIIQTNRAADRLFGTPDKNEPFFCRDLLKCGKTEAECHVLRVLNKRNAEHEYCSFFGRNYLVESNPISNIGTGIIHGVVSSFLDVTELNVAISSRQAVNDCLINLVREKDMRFAMEKSIRGICEHLGASRCYIVQFDTVAKSVSCFLEYSPMETVVMNQMQNRLYSTNANWEDVFLKNPMISFPDQKSLLECEGLSSYHEAFAQYDVQSVYAHRILLNGKLWGYVSALYEHASHAISSSEIDFIGSIAYCIELMLLREGYQTKIFDALRQAQSADQAKSMFLASMSHEIRTPLNAVLGFAELLKDGSLPKETENEYLEAISFSGNSLLALINDVLDLSKLEAGQMVFTPTDVEFPSLLRSVGSIFQQKCAEKKIELKLMIPADFPSVRIDKLRVRQVLFNLLGNAVKFTDAGTITLKAEFEKCTRKTGTLRFSVADTGMGIPEDDQKRIFHMFVQSNAVRGTQAEHNGTGLGLAICKRMIEKMNGKLCLKSTPGIGSEFTVDLCDVEWGDPVTKKDSPEFVSQPAAIGDMTVLVADDVSMNLRVISAMLEKFGKTVRVLTVKNADEAWDLLESGESVDFFLTDLWMPGMNGAELAAKIRRSGKYPRLVIAALTADVEGGDSFDMSVFDTVLTKPVTFEKLQRFLNGGSFGFPKFGNESSRTPAAPAEPSK